MIKLSNTGAYLLNGAEVVECNGEEQAALAAKTGSSVSKKKLQKIRWHTKFLKAIIRPEIWTNL